MKNKNTNVPDRCGQSFIDIELKLLEEVVAQLADRNVLLINYLAGVDDSFVGCDV
jgi:hypothetical protein